MLLSLPELPLCLDYIEAVNCKRLHSLPELPSNPKELDASELERIHNEEFNLWQLHYSEWATKSYSHTAHFRCNFAIGAVLPDGMIIESDHLVLGYSPCMDVKLLNGVHTTALFEFNPIKKYPVRNIKGSKVKCCGVCPLYAQPDVIEAHISVEKLATINQDSGEAVLEEYTNEQAHRFGSCCGGSDEEPEPHPKRLCRNQIKNKE
ncbi:hypothetical protein Pint_31060 [Pistacia integerrima]|uniref:Uncharacterized protein n=1 Tax=Pistacia integerrima TaxID=434235 RepID=A0ACC0XMR2_9ROSI|nr:hypothetical protein Pint_31060 [Pistacia integerrima]